MNTTTPASPAIEAPHSADWSGLKWGAALVALAAIVYWPTLNNGFIWDDDAYVQNNVQLRTLDGLTNIWFRLGAVPQYYPLVHTSFWLEYQAWGLYPTGYHLTNLALHMGSAILIWRLLLRLAVPGAWLAAAIFAVHPVAVESVAWVTERKNVLSCALALGSLLAYLSFNPPDDATAKSRSRPGIWGWYALSLALFLGALLSKTVTASVPAVLLVIYWWKRGRISWRDAAPLVPFFAVGLALAYVTVWMEQTHVGAVGPEWDLSFAERSLIAGRAVWFYAGKLFFPYPLIFFYHRWTIDSAVWWQYLFPLVAVAVLVVLWLARKRVGRGPLAAALIFGGVLLPALGYFNVYPFRFSFVADHFQYHASIALIALAAAAGAVAFERWTSADSPLRVLAAGGVLLILGAITQERTRAYRDLVTLYEDTLAKNPTSWAARFNLGESLLTQGKPDQGIEEIREAVRLSPEQPWLRTGLASALFTIGQTDEAEAEFRQALADPLHDVARADALVRLGVLLAKKGNLDEAIDCFRQAIELRKDNSRAIYNYGLALSKRGDHQAGIDEVRRALAITPYDPEAQHGLGVMLSLQGKLAESLVHLEQAVALHPTSAAYREDLGSTLFTSGEVERAAQQLAEAVRLNPNSAKAHYLLGAVLAERGRHNGAIREFEAALKLDPNLPGAANSLQRARERRGRSTP